jgi:hypothetical protein
MTWMKAGARCPLRFTSRISAALREMKGVGEPVWVYAVRGQA